MLYILYMRNHPELTYRGGQHPILHLQSDLNAVIDWANLNGIRWAFSDSNAGAGWVNFYNDPDDLGEVNWAAIASSDFRDPQVKDGKQAEFLVFDSFPWTLVEKIGTIDNTVLTKTQVLLRDAAHQPVIAVEPSWYYRPETLDP